MPNIFEAVLIAMKSLVDNERKNPLHTGEVTSAWVFLATVREALIYEQIGLNTTSDAELKKALDEAKAMCSAQADQVETFLLREGVPLPPTPEPKPSCDASEIPMGVKLTDDEIANGLSIKIAAAIVECATEVSNAIRTDFGQMFAGFLGEYMAFGTTFKQLMNQRGWLKIPPYYVPPGTPVSKKS